MCRSWLGASCLLVAIQSAGFSFKALPGSEFGYLWESLFPVVSIILKGSRRENILCIPEDLLISEAIKASFFLYVPLGAELFLGSTQHQSWWSSRKPLRPGCSIKFLGMGGLETATLQQLLLLQLFVFFSPHVLSLMNGLSYCCLHGSVLEDH